MTKEEFIKKLKENKWFDDPQELINYRLPVVQYGLNNVKANIIVNNQFIDFNNIKIIYKEEDFTLVNQAFELLRRNNS